ncbi:hypothetical protein VEx25_0283 [Vibrio antiquarius]|uniref:Uncharacterized protein n=1 Tax=Vibrio antiquarius (strain Ex25) TaxID=150340 RepID=A0ABM9WRD0_VIBAE|nr:hypothetical protein VEx25_0283 [Vibrio antiquarius]
MKFVWLPALITVRLFLWVRLQRKTLSMLWSEELEKLVV